MAISSYSELKTAVGNWLHRSDLASLIPDFIAMGEARIYRDLRIRAMETALNSAISAGTVPVPSGYIELKHAYINGSPVSNLTRKNPEWIYQNYPTRSASAKPLFVAREGENFIFGPYPDSAYTVKGIYYKRLPALSDSNTANWFTANAPDLLLCAAMVDASEYSRDSEALAYWTGKYGTIKDAVQRDDTGEAFSGSVLSVSPA